MKRVVADAASPQSAGSRDEAGMAGGRMQRSAGIGRLAVRRTAGRTRIARLFQEGSAKIRLPQIADGEALEAVLINTSGGLTGGDRIDWRIEAEAGASAIVTTQACEKVYRAAAGEAVVTTEIAAGAGAHVSWLPQETILFDRSALRRRLTVSLAEGATALLVEPIVFGRAAMGEAVRTATMRDRWRISVGGRLMHAEDFAIGPDVAGMLGRGAVTGGARAVATLLWIHPDAEAMLERVRAAVGDGDGGAASAWRVDAVPGTGKLLARFAAGDSYALRKRLMPVIALLNGQAAGRADLPKVWSI